MLGIIITFLIFVLVLITLFMGLVILMQRPNTNAGMGAAFGGGVTESTFGAETTNVLTRATKWSAAAFFIIALLLYTLFLIQTRPAEEEAIDLPELTPAEESNLDDVGGTTAAPTASDLQEASQAMEQLAGEAAAEREESDDEATPPTAEESPQAGGQPAN
ncbi:MAG: preprotein translocase subunit SecG [Opitutales bacterium]